MSSAIEHPFRTLQSLGWQWQDGGALLSVAVDGVQHSVWVPIGRVQCTFSNHLAAVGCPLPQSVGGAQSVGGFFSSIGKAFKKAVRTVKKAIPKSIKRAAKSIYRKASKAVRSVSRFAKKVGKALTSKEMSWLIAGLGVVVPVLAPAAGAIVAAQTAMRHIKTGLAVAKRVQQGARVTKRMAKMLTRAEQTKRRLGQVRQHAIKGNRHAQETMGALARLAV
jgi:hypothetical protein